MIVSASVTPDQPVNGRNDGNTEPDWLIDPDDQQVLQLRAERDARDRDGRTYTMALRAADSAGNLSDPSEVTVLVPHDQYSKTFRNPCIKRAGGF